MQSYSLSEVISLNKGKKQNECNEFDKNAIRYIQIDDLRNDNNLKFTNDKKRVEVNDQDVLIAWDGANAGTIGFNLEGAIGSTIAAIRIKKEFIGKVEPIYLGLFLRSKEKYLRERATGATIPHIQKDSLLNLLLPLAALDKQRMIAQILDKSTALIAKRKAQIAELDKLVQGVFLEMFGDPVHNPRKWNKDILKNITEITSSKRIFEKDYVDTGIPFYRTKEIVELSRGDSISTKLFISEEKYHDIRKKFSIPKVNDLLISAVGTIGEIWIVNTERPFYFKDGNLLWVKSNRNISPIYLKYVLNMFVERYKLSMPKGTAYAALTIEKLKMIEILLPPLEIQAQFAQIVEKIHAQKSLLQKSLAELEVLHQALMQKAFNGQLVG